MEGLLADRTVEIFRKFQKKKKTLSEAQTHNLQLEVTAKYILNNTEGLAAQVEEDAYTLDKDYLLVREVHGYLQKFILKFTHC